MRFSYLVLENKFQFFLSIKVKSQLATILIKLRYFIFQLVEKKKKKTTQDVGLKQETTGAGNPSLNASATTASLDLKSRQGERGREGEKEGI